MQSNLLCAGVFVLVASHLGFAVPAAAQGADARPNTPSDGEWRSARVTLEGIVLALDGSPTEGAVVVASAGGQAVTDAAGSYRLEVELPLEATSVQITAVASADGNLVASADLAIGGAQGVIRVDPLPLARGGSCSPAWLPTFGGEPGTNGWIRALAVYDDGRGSALYAGGRFTTVAGMPARGIAKWDGSSWSAVGGGVDEDRSTDSSVHALLVHDDGRGPALYVGGGFTSVGGVTVNHVARWDGSRWLALGGGVSELSGLNASVRGLAVHDDGSGPALYAGGGFHYAGGVAASNIAKWDGSGWSALGSGVNCDVEDLASYDDGSGPALYAGGCFVSAGGVSALRIAKWDGSSWSPLGTGVFGAVSTLAVHDDGTGPALYAGGNFSRAGSVRTTHIARWDGSSWSALGSGIGPSPNTPSVDVLAVHDDGSGPALFAGGSFSSAGGVPARNLARWDGSSWSALDSGVDSFVGAFGVYDDGGGPALYAGGIFSTAGSVAVSGIARWDGSSWSALGSGLNRAVSVLAVHDDGGGPALYAGGPYLLSRPGGWIARWNGSGWSALGSGFGLHEVRALASYDDGGGPALYAGGAFPGGVARWDGLSWLAPGGGVSGPNGAGVGALVLYDDGAGPALYAAGGFTTAGGVPANRIARWDGSTWSALGSGLYGGVTALAVYDDGSGPALYAGGGFSTTVGGPLIHVARWNGSSWSGVGAVGEAPNGQAYVLALLVHDDGRGPALYAGGYFTTASGVPANHIAKWDGSHWSALGSGVAGGLSGIYPYLFVSALAVYDDGGGPALYAGGSFSSAGGMAANGLAKWDGSRWSPLGRGVSSAVWDLAVLDGPARGGPALIVGGEFNSAFDSGDSYLARWQGCPDTTPPVLSCPTSIAASDPRSSPPGEIVTFTVTATDDRDVSPFVVCVPPSGSFFPPGVTLVHCKARDGARNQSNCSFPVIIQRKHGQ